jgi:UDPglucose 6-dehydrogenase
MEKIGIIGQGFVGNAVYQKFKEAYEVLTYDLIKDKCNSTFKEVVDQCEFIFLCLPTPMGDEGKCNTFIVEDVLREISYIAKSLKIIILKSTIPPGKTDSWNVITSNVYICFNPEFLTAANAVEDFANQDRIIIGGIKTYAKLVGKLYKVLFPKVKIVYTTNRIAEMVKYVANTFLAMKVSYANEIYEFCKEAEIDYDEVAKYTMLDKRLGKTHWAVPGPDGDFGFGGACFPKDVNAMIYHFKLYDVDPIMLEATWKKNLKVRKEYKND